MPHAFCLAALLSASVAMNAEASPRRIELAPPASEVGFRAYGLGLLPLDGRFTRFQGWLTYDPDDHAACHVDLSVEVASLAMDDTSVRATVVGPDFMDAPVFPALVYQGQCESAGIGGTLGLHGVTRPFTLSLAWRNDTVVASGELLRAQWGMTAMPFLAGRTVRIRVSIPLPEHLHADRN